MVQIGYDATTLGAHDLYMGIDYLRTLLGEVPLTVVSANVHDEATGELVVEPYVVVDKGGVKFAITGVLDSEIDLRTHRDVETHGVTVGEPYEALGELVPQLREMADFVVLLSHTGLPRAKDIVAQVPGIDFVLVGNHSAYSKEPYEIEGTVFIQPGYKGQYFSDYRLSFDAEGEYAGYTGTSFPLDDRVPSDASMALLLKEHKLAVEAASKDRAAEQARIREAKKKELEGYKESCIGVNDSCRRCHEAQYEKWEETAHAHAFETLEEGNQSTNPACLKCHTTCSLNLPEDGSVSVEVSLRSVQCESCHGMGTEHARDGSYGAVVEATCANCHDEENSPDFDLATYLPKVAH